MKLTFLSLFVLLLANCCAQENNTVQILPAHSHNDYEQSRPLWNALDCRFKSVEADVYSIGDSLFVAHNFDQIRSGRTLRKMYLDPLRKKIEQNHGSVYGNGEEVILLIDIKDDGLRTYRLLDKILQNYAEYLSVFDGGTKKTGSLMVVISGNRPLKYMQSQKVRYAGYDGRLSDLNSGLSPTLMPMISDNWTKYFTWNGTGKMPDKERQKLKDYATKAKNKGYILRFWGTPNQTPDQRFAIWTELKNAGVGLIGADHLEELERFLSQE